MQVASAMSPEPDDNDPLSIQPPVLETLDERRARLDKEYRAKEISDRIDEEIEKARAIERRLPKPVRVLLLGQSESGKSTTLKNFQLMYDPRAFRAERASWRAVIQLNVVQSLRIIIDAMDRAQKYENGYLQGQNPRKGTSHLTPELLEIKDRLIVILNVERTLIRRITGGANELIPTNGEASSMPFRNGLKELAINSTIPWKNALNRLVKVEERNSFDSAEGIDWDDPEDPWPLFHEHLNDMVQLWRSPAVKQLLNRQKIKADDLNEYFLDSIDRIAGTRYVPTDDDILRARLKTLGVSEHRFKIATSTNTMRDWRIYDVGGHRSQRPAWAPFFDDMDAIIFLAPISGFDQVLEEDHRINRLEDSIKLWTMVVTNQLLKSTNIILFLNKIDIFRAKLASGILLKDYVVSYGDRPNDFESTAGYLRRKFAGVMQETRTTRLFYCHFTSVTVRYRIPNRRLMSCQTSKICLCGRISSRQTLSSNDDSSIFNICIRVSYVMYFGNTLLSPTIMSSDSVGSPRIDVIFLTLSFACSAAFRTFREPDYTSLRDKSRSVPLGYIAA